VGEDVPNRPDAAHARRVAASSGNPSSVRAGSGSVTQDSDGVHGALLPEPSTLTLMLLDPRPWYDGLLEWRQFDASAGRSSGPAGLFGGCRRSWHEHCWSDRWWLAMSRSGRLRVVFRKVWYMSKSQMDGEHSSRWAALGSPRGGGGARVVMAQELLFVGGCHAERPRATQALPQPRARDRSEGA